jgi:hypothetical protein
MGKFLNWIFASSLLVGAIGDAGALQQPASEQQRSTSDSSWVAWSEAATFEIDRLRLIRWLRAHQDTISVTFLSQLVELQREANEFVKLHDYVTAQLILDTALELAGLRSTPAMAPADSGLARTAAVAPLTSSASSWEWRREVVFGIDLWRQEFEVGSAAGQTPFVDRDGNPYVGLRISLNRNANSPAYSAKSTRPESASPSESRKLYVTGNAMAKSSRDYFSGELEFNGRQSLGAGAYWRFENRLEGTRYRRNFDLQYWQNTTSALASVNLGKNFRLEVADELRWRRYREQSGIYPNYIQNQASLGTVFNSGYTTRLDSRYSFVARGHDLCPSADYLEHRIDASIFQSTATFSSIFIENIWRNRIYTNRTAGDTCPNTYQNTYQEEYARGDLRLGLSETVGLRLEGDFTLRQHQVPNQATPDFLHTTVNPQLTLNLFSDLQLSFGYLYLLRVHDKDIIQVTPGTTAGDNSGLSEQDYYSHGFTFGVDLIRTSGILLNVKEVYEIRTYPNAAKTDLFYVDSNINSLLLFLSWNFFSHWQVGILANFDNDRSRTDTPRDSRYTLFAIDLGYSF